MLTQRQIFESSGCARGSVPRKHRLPLSMNVGVFFGKFPWALNYLDYAEVDQAYVVQMEPRLLNYRPQFIDRRSIFSCTESEWLRLLDRNGEKVIRKCIEIRPRLKYRFFGPTIRSIRVHKFDGLVDKRSTVGEVQKTLLEKAARVRFILSYYVGTHVGIVYEVPEKGLLEEGMSEKVQ